MMWKEFDYFAPTMLDEAVDLLTEYGRDARVLAGGTDLVLRLKTGQWRPRCVVNIKHIPGLNGIGFDPASGLRLGTLVTAADLAQSEVVQTHYPALAQGASVMASLQIRYLATVGGNLCNAAPSADLAPPLIALEGSAVIVGANGQRQVPLDGFFLGPGQTVLEPGELLIAITMPPPPPDSAAVYLKNGPRRAMDIAVVGVAVAMAWSDGSAPIPDEPEPSRPMPAEKTLLKEQESPGLGPRLRCEDVRIVLGAVAPTPLRVPPAEELLRRQEITEERIAEAARIAAREARPIDDVRGSVWYRRRMVEVLTRRALLQLTGA